MQLHQLAFCAAVTSVIAFTCGARAATSTVRITSGISRPVFATAPPGDTERLFILEQHTGRIEIIDPETGSELGLFLGIDGLATGNEQGLLGMAFDPDYATNGFFYVNFNPSAGRRDDMTHIRRYKVEGDPATSNVADADSGFDVLTFNQPQSNHNGGWIGFSPNDGYLYIASGDGGGGGDNHGEGGNGQDITNNLLGKILRIDPSRAEMPTQPYTIPDSNPFIGKAGDDEIWSYGLRNPYRASFDRLNGDLWIADVGQDAKEEIDYQPADSAGGENYGWRVMEGNNCFDNSQAGGNPPCRDASFTPPVYDYGRGGGPLEGYVVIGGYVYRGPVAAFQGHYFFADGASNNIWKLDPDAVDIPASVTRVNDLLTPDAGSIASIGSFGEDAVGNLYIMEVFGGELFKIVTTSQKIVWNGDDSSAGTAGDGSSWNDANNWTRGGTADEPFVADDHVIFANGSSQSTIDLEGDRTVAAVTFQAPQTLANNTLQVLSGNVAVDSGVTAKIESDLTAESENHSLRKLGRGTLLVGGSAGQAVVKEGTLGGTGTFDHLSVRSGATLAPGDSPGILSVSDSFTLHPGSTLEIELGGTDNSDLENPEYDRLEIGGVASLAGGTLNVSLIRLGEGEFVPSAGDTFAILAADGGLDMFGTVNLPVLEPGLRWLVDTGNVTMSLIVATGLPGDYNQDGTVDAADYVAWRDTLGQEVVAGSRADGNGDGAINQDDYDLWQSNWGASDEAGANVHVPEPATAILWCLVCWIVGHRAVLRVAICDPQRPDDKSLDQFIAGDRAQYEVI